MPPLDRELDVSACTTGAHETPAAAAVEQIWNSTVPVSPPTVPSAKVARSCGIVLVSSASAGAVNPGVDGATLSIFQLYDAGLVSRFPAGSVARTSNVCV